MPPPSRLPREGLLCRLIDVTICSPTQCLSKQAMMGLWNPLTRQSCLELCIRLLEKRAKGQTLLQSYCGTSELCWLHQSFASSPALLHVKIAFGQRLLPRALAPSALERFDIYQQFQVNVLLSLQWKLAQSHSKLLCQVSTSSSMFKPANMLWIA